MEIIIYIIFGLLISGLLTLNLLKTIWDADTKKMQKGKQFKENYTKFLKNRQLKKQAKKETEEE